MYKVGVIGPESTGKSTLSKYLANRYDGLWVPEYAREYMESLAPMYAYTHEDVLRIAEFQVLQMRELCEHHRLLLSKGYRRDTEGISQPINGLSSVFFDTELIITKVWLLHKYGECPTFVEQALRTYPMDVYLLCYPDLPWQPDPVRENPMLREYLFDWYEREIQALGIPYYIIKHE